MTTTHVVSTLGNELYIKRVMMEEMEKAIGLSPHMKIEYWKPSFFNEIQ